MFPLDEFRRGWEAGAWPAVTEALRYCRRTETQPPEWLYEAAIQVVQAYFDTEKKAARKTGRHAKPGRRYLENQEHYRRWDLVTEWLDRRGELGLVPADATLDDAFTAVAEFLGGGNARKGVKRSYLLVENEMKAGRGRQFMVFRGK